MSTFEKSVALVLFFLMYGCNPAPTVTIPDTPTKTFTPIPPTNTNTPTYTATTTPSPIPTATSTLTPTATPRTINLKSDGSGDYIDLPAAINSAQPGDIIHLEQGTYKLKEKLDIYKPITLLGDDMDKTIIHGSSDEIGTPGITFYGKGLFSMQNITLKYVGNNPTTMVSIKSGKFDINNCYITGGTFTQDKIYYGVYIGDDVSGNLQNSKIDYNGGGIGVYNEAKITIEGNIFSNPKFIGINILENSSVTIKSNQFKNWFGIGIRDKANVIIDDNDFTGNTTSIYFTDNANGIVKNNRIMNNKESIKMEGNSDVTLEDNIISDGIGGIFFEGESSGKVLRNQITNNAIGISIWGNAQVLVEENSCIDNAIGITFSDDSGGTISRNKVKSVRKTSFRGGGVSWRIKETDGSVGSGIWIEGNSAPILEENICSESANIGIGFVENAKGIARKNECTKNQIGIFVASTANPTLEDNICEDNIKEDVDDQRIGPSPN